MSTIRMLKGPTGVVDSNTLTRGILEEGLARRYVPGSLRRLARRNYMSRDQEKDAEGRTVVEKNRHSCVESTVVTEKE